MRSTVEAVANVNVPSVSLNPPEWKVPELANVASPNVTGEVLGMTFAAPNCSVPRLILVLPE